MTELADDNRADEHTMTASRQRLQDREAVTGDRSTDRDGTKRRQEQVKKKKKTKEEEETDKEKREEEMNET